MSETNERRYITGPWTVDGYRVMADPRNNFPAIVAEIGGPNPRACTERARLIAEAPNLLQALEALNNALIPMDYSDYKHADELASAIISARAAIGKARN